MKNLMLAAALAALAVPFATAQSQAPAAPAPSFEVASIKPNKSGTRGGMIRNAPGGRFTVHNIPLKMLISMAYRVQGFQVTGASGWMESEKWDIEAKPPEGAVVDPPRMNPEDPEFKRQDAIRRQMIQSLLADRFHLQIHRETKEMPVYALVVAKGGSKLQPSGPIPDFKPSDFAKGPPPGGKFPGMRMSPGALSGNYATIGFLVQALSNMLDRTVLDETGLKGTFDFELKWAPDESQGPMMRPPGEGAPPPPADGPSIFTALQEQLGLKLESKKGPVEVLVIDHAEQPSEN